MFHVLDNPIMFDFRQIKVHRKKVKKAIAKKNRDLADRLLNRPPTYKLDKLVLERYQVKYNCFFRSSSSTVCSINFFFCLFNRYPTFVDALRDLDDCLTLVHLFAALPAVDGERVEVNRIHNCRRFVLFDIAKFSQPHVNR